MIYAEVDVQLVAMGYLVSPEGRWRHIEGLDLIAEDTLHFGARVWWGPPIRSNAASANPLHREIILSPALFRAAPGDIRTKWSHELGHIAVGRCCEDRARWWQLWRFNELLAPVWMA